MWISSTRSWKFILIKLKFWNKVGYNMYFESTWTFYSTLSKYQVIKGYKFLFRWILQICYELRLNGFNHIDQGYRLSSFQCESVALGVLKCTSNPELLRLSVESTDLCGVISNTTGYRILRQIWISCTQADAWGCNDKKWMEISVLKTYS